MKKLILKLFLTTIFLLTTAVAVSAGGWATITFEEMPQKIVAGEETTIVFKVWQHGNKPVQSVLVSGDKVILVVPIVTAQNAITGETLEVAAQPTKMVGVFQATLIFPSEGDWAWQIMPEPLHGETVLENLDVQVATAVGTTSPINTPPSLATWPLPLVGILLLLTATLLFVLFLRRHTAEQQKIS